LSTSTDDYAGQLLEHARRLVGLELSKQEAALAGRNELAGQMLEDIVRSAITSSEASRRLPAVGVDPWAAHSVVLLGPADSRSASRRSVDRRASLLRDPSISDAAATTARVGPFVAVVLPDRHSPVEVARQLSDGVGSQGDSGVALGIGGPYRGVHGLRWAFLEAQEAVARGPGVNERRPISMPRVLMSNPDLPLRELGQEVLRPLTDFDAATGGELLRTLRAFLAYDGSLQATARALVVHRNTVRYRLQQIEKIAGVSLTSTEARVHLWLALLAVGAV
jgi:purine catabolism regulator